MKDAVTASGGSAGGGNAIKMNLIDPQLFAGIAPLFGNMPWLNMPPKTGQETENPIDLDKYEYDLQQRVNAGEIGQVQDVIKGQPSYFFIGELDWVFPAEWREMQVDLYRRLGANVKYDLYPKFGHYAPQDVFGTFNQFFADSFGYKFDDERDENWSENGLFNTFD